MIYPAYSFASLAEAVILLSASIFTFNRLYQGSKSKFAYLLVAFTFAYVINKIAHFISNLYPNETVQLSNGYAEITNIYFYFLLSLQSWIFGMKYLWSGTVCTLESTCLTLDCIKFIGWIGGLCFAIFMITCYSILMATFPGYTDIPKWE